MLNKEYQFHPLANIFPLIDGQSYKDLMADVLKHGVREPVWLYEGQILDGRNRYRAAVAMGVHCPVQEYTGQDATSFVISLNIHRRHLSETQRGNVAAKLANMKAGDFAGQSACALCKFADTTGKPVRCSRNAERQHSHRRRCFKASGRGRARGYSRNGIRRSLDKPCDSVSSIA